jgi:hypothetical protein
MADLTVYRSICQSIGLPEGCRFKQKAEAPNCLLRDPGVPETAPKSFAALWRQQDRRDEVDPRRLGKLRHCVAASFARQARYRAANER